MNYYDGQLREAVPIESTSWRFDADWDYNPNPRASWNLEQFMVAPASQWQPLTIEQQVAMGRGASFAPAALPVPRGCRPDWGNQKNRLLVPSVSGRGTWCREVHVACPGELAIELGEAHSAWEVCEYWKRCRVVAVKRVHRPAKAGAGSEQVRARTKRSLQDTCGPLVDEFRALFPIAGPAAQASSVREDVAAVGRLITARVLERDKMPWRNERFESTASFDWDIAKTSLLNWDYDSMVLLGSQVHEALKESVGEAVLTGCVGQPLYTCMGTRFVTPFGQPVAADAPEAQAAPCGATALLSLAEDSFLELPAGATCWLCQDCMDNRRTPQQGTPNRMVRLFPTVQTTSGGSMVYVPGKPPCVLLLHPSPVEWQFPALGDWADDQPVQARDVHRRLPALEPTSILLPDGSPPRVLYSDVVSSDTVWNLAGRYGGRQPEALKPGRRFAR